MTRGDFHTVRVASFPARLIASPTYLAERGRPQKPIDLQEHTLRAWVAPGEDGMRWPLRSGGWIRVDSAVRSTDIETVRGLANAGLGVAFVPDAEEVRLLIHPERARPRPARSRGAGAVALDLNARRERRRGSHPRGASDREGHRGVGG